MYEFWYDYVKLTHGEKAKLCYFDTVSLYISKQMIFIKVLQKMLKLDSILQIMSQIDRYQKKNIKKQLD